MGYGPLAHHQTLINSKYGQENSIDRPDAPDAYGSGDDHARLVDSHEDRRSELDLPHAASDLRAHAGLAHGFLSHDAAALEGALEPLGKTKRLVECLAHELSGP